MNIKEGLKLEQLDKLEDLGVVIENEEYTEEEVLELEKELLEYIEENCLQEGEDKDNINAKLTDEGYEIRKIVETLSDILYSEGDADLVDDILEESEMKVKLKDVCEHGSSSLKQSDVMDKSGNYPICRDVWRPNY